MANTENSREARFRVIETLLLWEGEVDNGRLRTLLDIQNVQASRVLSEYAARNPAQIRRPSPRSPYLAAPGIKPSYSAGTVEEYLELLRIAGELGGVIEDARVDLTAPVAKIFSTVLQACRRNCGLNMEYRSMTTPGGSHRLIFPHPVVRAGRRWHVRAWCTERKDFRDFVIGRIVSAALDPGLSSRPKSEDAAWGKKLPVVLGAHPALSRAQEQVIRDEYFAGAVSRRLLVRSCLLFYVVQDLRAAVNPAKEKPPEFQLVVNNAEDLRPYLLQQAA